MGPTNATTVPVRSAAPAKTRRFTRSASTPSSRAPSSPSARRLSARAWPRTSQRPRRGREGEHGERARRNGRHAAEEPVDDAAEAVGVHDRDQHGDRGRKEDADDDARQEERVHRQPARRGRDQVHGHARDESAREAEGGQPQRLHDPLAEPGHLAQHHAERGAARDAQDRGLGQRVAREGLEARAGDGQRGAGEHRGGDARKPDREDHGALGALARAAAGDEVEDRSGRDRRGADEERAESHDGQGGPGGRRRSMPAWQRPSFDYLRMGDCLGTASAFGTVSAFGWGMPPDE